MSVQWLFAGTILVVFGLMHASQASAGGGPDASGYTWQSSADPGGPAANWVSVSGAATQVTGLADDNAAATLLVLPAPFRFYGQDYSALKVGSNGWLAFNTSVGNIAHCFPLIPTAGGAADGYLAPLMTDLNFTGAGNIGSVFSEFDGVNNRFVVSYLNVPFWTNAGPGWTGSNTFQVLLDYRDYSIHFNYQSLSPLTDNGSCNSDVVVGIESGSGQVGLAVTADVMPVAPLTIKFYPPAVFANGFE